MSATIIGITPNNQAVPAAWGAPAAQGTKKPLTGAKVYTVTLPFSGTVTEVDVDLTIMIQGGQFDPAQSIFVQNFLGTANIAIQCGSSGVQIQAPAETQGWYNIPSGPQNQKYKFITTGGSPITVTFANYYVDPIVWTNGGSGTATTVTANQGTPGAAPWPVVVEVGGTPVSGASPFPVVDTANAQTNFSFANPPVSGVTTAAQAQEVGGVVYTIAGAANGSQLPLQLTPAGLLAVADAPVLAELTTMETTLNTINTSVQFSMAAPGGALPARATVISGEFLSSPPTRTTATVSPLLTDVNGNLLVNVSGNSPAVIDSVAPAAASATGAAMMGAQFVSAPTEWTTGQQGAVLVDSYGAQKVSIEGLKPTYSAQANSVPFTSGVAADLAFLQGSASKVVRVTRIGISALDATAGGNISIVVNRRSGATAYAPAGSVAASPLQPAHDFSVDPAATAAVHAITGTLTAFPTPGGSYRAAFINLGFSTDPSGLVEFEFGNQNDKALVVRGVQDYIAITVTVGPATSGTCDIYFEWTEE